MRLGGVGVGTFFSEPSCVLSVGGVASAWATLGLRRTLTRPMPANTAANRITVSLGILRSARYRSSPLQLHVRFIWIPLDLKTSRTTNLKPFDTNRWARGRNWSRA